MKSVRNLELKLKKKNRIYFEKLCLKNLSEMLLELEHLLSFTDNFIFVQRPMTNLYMSEEIYK